MVWLLHRKKDEVQNEGEGKESLKIVWGEGRQKEEALLKYVSRFV
jgi:hypothetical protein